jgi:hypothetical protein
MPRYAILFLVSAVVLVGGVSGALRSPVFAQDDTPLATANHPIVGGWRCKNDNPGASFTSFALFHDDGTYVEEVFYGATALGVWQATGERTADLNIFFTDLDPAEEGILMGEGRFTMEVDETGDTFTLEGVFQGQDPDGTVLFTDVGLESHCTRLAVNSMEAMATPMVATPGA